MYFIVACLCCVSVSWHICWHCPFFIATFIKTVLRTHHLRVNAGNVFIHMLTLFTNDVILTVITVHRAYTLHPTHAVPMWCDSHVSPMISCSQTRQHLELSKIHYRLMFHDYIDWLHSSLQFHSNASCWDGCVHTVNVRRECVCAACVCSMPLYVWFQSSGSYLSLLWLLLSSLLAPETGDEKQIPEINWTFVCRGGNWFQWGFADLTTPHLFPNVPMNIIMLTTFLNTSWSLSNHAAPSMVTAGHAVGRKNHMDACGDKLNRFQMSHTCTKTHWQADASTFSFLHV